MSTPARAQNLHANYMNLILKTGYSPDQNGMQYGFDQTKPDGTAFPQVLSMPQLSFRRLFRSFKPESRFNLPPPKSASGALFRFGARGTMLCCSP